MEFTAEQIAGIINGKVIGAPTSKVSGFSPIEDGKEGHISFISQEKFIEYLPVSKSSIIIVSNQLLKDTNLDGKTIISVEDAYLAFQILLNLYQQMQNKKTGIETPSYIHETSVLEEVYVGAFAYISENVSVGNGSEIFPHVYIGKNVKIGRNCRIGSGVKIYDDCVVGDNCLIHSNTVIGGDGFGFQPTQNGYVKIPQLGNVILEDDVEIGSNCSLDRATVGSTIISKGTKIDNLIQIAHNVKIGQHNVIAAQAGIAGSTTIGDWNMIGGQAGIVGHINIGNKVKIQAQSGVNNNVKDNEILYGSPAISAGDYRRSYVHFRNFPEIEKRIKKLEDTQKNDN